MENFVYVFTKDSRDAMISKGYKILKNDERNNVYVFQNVRNMNFANFNFKFIVSDILTF